MSYLIIDKLGNQICECADYMDAMMMLGFDYTRTVKVKDPELDPYTVLVNAETLKPHELVAQKILAENQAEPFNP